MRYSAGSLLRNALSGQMHWRKVWREPEPKSAYDVIIVGGGGHGLATAHYLARNHGITNVAVLEKGYLGNGNIGRNTTIVRSNYLCPDNIAFYDHSLKLWEGLSQDLNYNVMLSQRGVLNVFHTPAQRDAMIRRGNAMALQGVDAVLLNRAEVGKLVPIIDISPDARFPVLGGLLQPRGGSVRHDAVAWGYARSGDAQGIDIIQNCEVTGFAIENGKVRGVQSNKGPITAKKVAICVAGRSSLVAAMAGLRLPIESHVLQSYVTEPVKPILDTVVSFGAAHFAIVQSDKGGLVFNGDLDGYNSYAQRGNMEVLTSAAACAASFMPCFSRLRMLRHWGGINDMTMDGSPIITKTPVKGLYFNGGWCYGGFKATPTSGWTYAHLIANDEPHELAANYSLSRFETGALINESGSGPVPGKH
ncbi:MAG: sarcosine oxidase subunit beta family protein [bacterium]|nr:sarcosine oxidase subunit beta family protein [bacterium]